MSKRGINRIVGAFLLILSGLLCLRYSSAAARNEKWIQFQDAQTGLTFRYPPNLHIQRRDSRQFGLDSLQGVVELVGDARVNPGTVVLRFLVKRGQLTGRARRQGSLVCMSTGSAAIRWSVEILKPRGCTIVTLMGRANADQALPPPHDGKFPLLSIMRTVRFTAPPGSVSR